MKKSCNDSFQNFQFLQWSSRLFTFRFLRCFLFFFFSYLSCSFVLLLRVAVTLKAGYVVGTGNAMGEWAIGIPWLCVTESLHETLATTRTGLSPCARPFLVFDFLHFLPPLCLFASLTKRRLTNISNRGCLLYFLSACIDPLTLTSHVYTWLWLAKKNIGVN